MAIIVQSKEVERQIQREEEALRKAKEKYKREFDKALQGGRLHETREGNILMKALFEDLTKNIQTYLDAPLKGIQKTRRDMVAMSLLDAETIAFVVLATTVKEIGKKNGAISLVGLSTNIIRSLFKVGGELELDRSNPKLRKYLESKLRRASGRKVGILISKHLKEFETAIKEGHSTGKNETTVRESLHAGIALIDLLLQTSDLFYLSREKGKKKRAKVVVMNSEYLKQIFEHLPPTLGVRHTPMLVSPRPWTNMKDGGYYTYRQEIVNVRDSTVLSKLRKSSRKLDNTRKGLNKLQAVPWRVNKRVYDVISNIYYGEYVDASKSREIPILYGNIPSPNLPALYDIVEKIPYGDPDFHIKNRHREDISIRLNREVGRRIQFLGTLEMAKEMLPEERFYYPYNVDYRGRVYPMVDGLSPQGQKYGKAMLEFADGRYLDDTGVYWLKVHIANTYGHDKLPFEDRVSWADQNLDDILDVAYDPMNNLKLWVHTDSPYEFLAACFAMLDHLEGKPVHTPIQLDAVSSGIQIYSGLLRDREGAEATCIIGQERNDLYSRVAEKVNDYLVAGDYPTSFKFTDSEGVEQVMDSRLEARSLVGKISRKLVKRGVMTTPYGVTRLGMREQIQDIMDEYKDIGAQFWEGDDWVVRMLLTELLERAIADVVKGAPIGQKFILDVLQGVEGDIMWTSPITGFPVYQLKHNEKSKTIETVLGRLNFVIHDDSIPPNIRKIRNGITPNFIHSLDSAILMHCSLEMDTDLGVIHDCFLVHPNDGEKIRDIFKDSFIKAMEYDPFTKFKESVNPESEVEVPFVGTFDLEEIRDAKYIIS